MKRHAGYVPLSALTPAEQARYRRELSAKELAYPHLFSTAAKGNAARAGLRARILSERGHTNF